jgi:20S proteasome subunit alpha 7
MSSGAGYDLSCTTYSPDGRVFQVEYAGKAVEKSGTAIGIKCRDGVVLGVEKLVTKKMLVPGSNRKIHTIDTHVGMAVAGLAADARRLASLGREEAAEYRSFYGTQVPGPVLAARIASAVHSHTLYWSLRPFGASALLATMDDENGPQLYCVDPVGDGLRYFGASIGRGKATATTELEKIDFDAISVHEACQIIATTIYKSQDASKEEQMELELSWIVNGKHSMVPEDLRNAFVQEAIATVERAAMESDED